MRKITRYSETFKASVLAKALAPNGPSRVELAKELNIPYGTLHTWIKMSKQQNVNQLTVPQRPNDKSAESKLQAIIDTGGMAGEELGAYCREHGIYTVNLEEWKKQILSGFSPTATRKNKSEHQRVVNEVKQLKSDLHRKDKALAEVSALLILKKKADLLWGTAEDA